MRDELTKEYIDEIKVIYIWARSPVCAAQCTICSRRLMLSTALWYQHSLCRPINRSLQITFHKTVFFFFSQSIYKIDFDFCILVCVPRTTWMNSSRRMCQMMIGINRKWRYTRRSRLEPLDLCAYVQNIQLPIIFRAWFRYGQILNAVSRLVALLSWGRKDMNIIFISYFFVLKIQNWQ